MRDHRKLIAFELADKLVLDVYQATKCFPREEVFGLTSQFRRAAVSVVANIVEGCARRNKKEYLQFLNIAFGSLRETGYYIELTQKLGYMDKDIGQALTNQYNETAKVLSGLMTSIRNKRLEV